MAKHRDVIDEITSKLSREGNQSAYEARLRLMWLEVDLNWLEQQKGMPRNLLQGFPIALVGCLEGFYRRVIREFIDRGNPYLDNAGQLLLALNKDSSVKALFKLSSANITIGTYVSHVVQISRFGHICEHLNTLTGEDFYQALKSVTHPVDLSDKGEKDQKVIQNPGRIFDLVNDLFEARHILAHELMPNIELDIELVREYIDVCKKLVDATIGFQNTQFDIPKTLEDFEKRSTNRFHRAQRSLESVISELKIELRGSPRVDYLEKAQTLWDDLVKLNLSFENDRDYVKEGRLASPVDFFEKIELSEEIELRVDHLQRILSGLRRYNSQ